jgi:hypothetical protein
MAIVINDTSTSGYITGSGNYTGVVQILFNHIADSGTYLCSGALISPVQILTAGHCISGADNWDVWFQTPSGTYGVGVTQTALDPLYAPRPAPIDNLPQYDVGILTLAAPAPSDAQIYGLDLSLSNVVYDTSVMDIVGYGLGGGASGPVLGFGTRRHAQNTVAGEIGTLNGVSTPDLPLAMLMTFGEGSGGTGLPNSGDSGGPMLFNGQILGVTSFGDLPASGTYPTGIQYLAGYTNLGNPVIGNWVESEIVPEPGTWALLGLGTLALFVLRRVRRYGLANIGAELDGREELGS